MEVHKSWLFTFSGSPYDGAFAREALDMALATAVFESSVSCLFLHDGVFQLMAEQKANASDVLSMEKSLQALPLYDVNNVYVCEQSLLMRSLYPECLFMSVQLLSANAMRQLYDQTQTVVCL